MLAGGFEEACRHGSWADDMADRFEYEERIGIQQAMFAEVDLQGKSKPRRLGASRGGCLAINMQSGVLKSINF
jgi:hypothetical protein